MTARNPRLYEAMRSLARQVLVLIAEHFPHGPAPELLREVEQFNKVLGRSDVGEAWGRIVSDLYFNRAFRESPEYQECLSALKADETIAPQIDQLGGTLLSRYARQEHHWTLNVIHRLGSAGWVSQFDQSAFDAAYEKFEEWAYTSTVTIEIVAPLLGFTTDRGRIELGDALTIETFDPAAYKHLPRLAVVGTIGGEFHRPRYAAFLRYTTPRVVGEPPEAEVSDETKRQQVRWERIQRLLWALNLFKDGGLTFEILAEHGISDNLGTMFQLPDATPRGLFPKAYALEGDEVDSFLLFWKKFESQAIRRRKVLEAAIRRFAYAGERSRIEDRLVDLVISAESLLLGEITARTELGYRFSLNAALLGRSGTNEPEQFHELFKQAYGARSAVVHGGKLPEIKLGGHLVTFQELSERFQERLRAFLHRGIDLAFTGAPDPLFDWNGMLVARLCGY